MTEINKDDVKSTAMEETRLKRRSILKAGAIIAPLAVTLHSGIPLAHAASTGCVQELVDNVRIPQYIENSNGAGYVEQSLPIRFNPETGVTGRTLPTTEPYNSGNAPETHWDYLINEELYGASCMTSIISNGLTVNYTP